MPRQTAFFVVRQSITLLTSWRMKHSLAAALSALLLLRLAAFAETPGEFRPTPFPNPTEKVGANGHKVQPLDTYPKSRAPQPPPPTRKPKLLQKASPALRGNDLVLNAGWEMVEAPRITVDGAALSTSGLDTHSWYDATV